MAYRLGGGRSIHLSYEGARSTVVARTRPTPAGGTPAGVVGGDGASDAAAGGESPGDERQDHNDQDDDDGLEHALPLVSGGAGAPCATGVPAGAPVQSEPSAAA